MFPTNFVTGTDYEASRADLDASDQASFIEAGVPAVQVLSGISADYHKVTDTADKIDYRGMVREGEFLKEIVDYLAGGSDQLTRPAAKAQGGPGAPPGERKASTGLVPSFEWQGKGVKADSVTPGSPLDAAGFRAGDVIVKINGVPTDDLRAYSAELKKYKPGEKIKLTCLSDNLEKELEIELAAR